MNSCLLTRVEEMFSTELKTSLLLLFSFYFYQLFSLPPKLVASGHGGDNGHLPKAPAIAAFAFLFID